MNKRTKAIIAVIVGDLASSSRKLDGIRRNILAAYDGKRGQKVYCCCLALDVDYEIYSIQI